KRGYLGISLESVHDEFAKVYGLPETKGAIVTSVTPTESGQATPAAKAGIQASDIIVEFEGSPVASAPDLIQRVASTPVGQQTTLVFLRDTNGKLEKKTVSVVLSERPVTDDNAKDWVEPTKSTSKSPDPKGNALHLGITLAELTPQLITERKLTGIQGLLVKDIDPDGLVAEIRLPPNNAPALVLGDVINRINRVPVNTLADFQRVLNTLHPGDPIVLNVTSTQRDRNGDRQVPRIVQFTYQ
ncbi:MAG TPA: PDZ domain-containing protein, partial [Pyrinomonadaceae bacterium]|nr:PDZ domain-containing protein [Pyrinomonadaceae bacterium]